jgi:hypothetical protein
MGSRKSYLVSQLLLKVSHFLATHSERVLEQIDWRLINFIRVLAAKRHVCKWHGGEAVKYNWIAQIILLRKFPEKPLKRVAQPLSTTKRNSIKYKDVYLQVHQLSKNSD